MSAQQPDTPADHGREIDAARAAFEKAWTEGGIPRIEPYLEQVKPELRSKLKETLLVTELKHKIAQGHRPDQDAYAARFPDCHDLICRTLNQETTHAEETGRGGDSKRPRGDLIGKTLSHYQIIEHLGSGGMGDVYLAEDTRLRRKVALKVLSSELIDAQERLRRFQREARAASALNHSHIITIYDIGESEEGPFIAMEYSRGPTLHNRISQGPVPLKEIIEIAVQIADALDAGHQEGIIHRDIKPSNISMNERAQVKVLDFGLAKRLMPEAAHDSHTISQDVTQEGTVLGTPKYMSPEQALGQEVDHRTDIFSFGVLLYELTTGRQPFSGSSFTDTVQKIIHSNPQAIARLNYDVPPELERIILKCLEKDPDDRYQSAKELLVDLRRLSPSVSVPANTGWAHARSRRRHVPLGTGIAVLLLAALVVGLDLGGARTRLAHIFGWGTPPGRIQSIAVLPLEMAGDAGNEFVADGITGLLISELGRISGLKVISRTSAMQYKNVHKPIPEVARELNVDAVIEGSVLLVAKELRVTTRLVDGRTDAVIWSENYVHDLRDIVSLQSTLAKTIARQVNITLTPQEEARLSQARPINPDAQLAYLRGQYAANQRTQGQLQQALAYYNEAIEKDPNYASAHVGIAETLILFGWYEILSPGEAVPRAEVAARKALQVDHTLGEAYNSLASVRTLKNWDWTAGDRDYLRAIELTPNYALAHHWYAITLAARGMFDEALAEEKLAKELDPLSPIHSANFAMVHYARREHDQAIKELRSTLALNPNFAVAHFYLGLAYLEKSMFDAAVDAHRKAVTYSNHAPVFEAALAHAYARAGQPDEARELLSKLEALSKERYVSASAVASIYLGLNDFDGAFRWLQESVRQRDPWVTLIKAYAFWDPLRADPRYADLLRQMKLEP